jgi:hypothetical protein
MRKKFEYMTLDVKIVGVPRAESLQPALDASGDDGWELVSTIDRTNGFYLLIFKREKS